MPQMTVEQLRARRAARGLADPLNRMSAGIAARVALDPALAVIECRPCRLEGYTYGHLDGYVTQDSQGFVARSHCGKVSIRLSAATVARKYDGESVPSIYYE